MNQENNVIWVICDDDNTFYKGWRNREYAVDALNYIAPYAKMNLYIKKATYQFEEEEKDEPRE